MVKTCLRANVYRSKIIVRWTDGHTWSTEWSVIDDEDFGL